MASRVHVHHEKVVYKGMLQNLHLNSLWVSYAWSNLLDRMELMVMLKEYVGLGVHGSFGTLPQSSQQMEGFNMCF